MNNTGAPSQLSLALTLIVGTKRSSDAIVCMVSQNNIVVLAETCFMWDQVLH